MAWLQLRLQLSCHQLATAEATLEALGAQSITLEDGGDEPLLEPGPGETPVWQVLTLHALFAAEADTAAIHRAVVAALGDEGIGWRTAEIADQAWERAWMQDYHPMCFGALWIVPRDAPAPQPEAVNVRLDPGLAFGTGTHPTTALCLEALAAHSLADKLVVDYGCGSGVLAIAALCLGARRAYAVDNDPQALTAARANAEHNGVADRLVVLAPPAPVPTAADMVLANILAQPLIELAPTLTAATRLGGVLLLSGVLVGQAPSVQAAYTPAVGFAETARRDGWACLKGARSW